MPSITITPEQLKVYLQRIQLNLDVNTLKPDIATLTLLHQQHVLNIPFEALSVHLDDPTLTMENNPIDLSMEAVFHKIVVQKRGGYCYEMNKLFAAVLNTIGFEISSHKAGVIWGYKEKRSPAHRMLTVKLDQEIYIVDVGFGGPGQLSPLRVNLDDEGMGREQEQGGQIYRVIKVLDGDIELQKKRSDESWAGLYGFNIDKTYKESDYEGNNNFTAMHPESTFVKLMICTMPVECGRISLTDNKFKYVLYENGKEEIKEQKILSEFSEYFDYLKEYFNLCLPLDASFNRHNKGNLLFISKTITYTYAEKIKEAADSKEPPTFSERSLEKPPLFTH